MAVAKDLPHLRLVRPLSFPASDPEWDIGRNGPHARLCDLLYQVLRAAAGPDSCVAADQFIYWDGSRPRKKCAPDGFLKLGVPQRDVDSWKVWELGAPDVCVEIVSASDAEKLTWDEKMERYLALGVPELVAYDREAPPGQRLRAWDRIDGDLVERALDAESTPCLALGLFWVVVPSTAPGDDVVRDALRLARDPNGQDLVLTSAEADKLRAEAAEAELARERAARVAAEEELARLRANQK